MNIKAYGQIKDAINSLFPSYLTQPADIRLFGHSGYCQLCLKQIVSNDWVMAIDGHQQGHRQHCRSLAHLDCFACSKCKGRFVPHKHKFLYPPSTKEFMYRFCVGEPFYYQDGLIFCQADFIGTNGNA